VQSRLLSAAAAERGRGFATPPEGTDSRLTVYVRFEKRRFLGSYGVHPQFGVPCGGSLYDQGSPAQEGCIVIAPHVVCANPDGTVSAYICELGDEETFSRWLALLSRLEARDELLRGTWSYGEYGIRGPASLVNRLVAELLTEMP
jgi:hypothetical protein